MFSLEFSSSLFVIRVNLLHHNHPYFFEVYYYHYLSGVFLSQLVNCYFHVLFIQFKVNFLHGRDNLKCLE